MNTQLSGVKLIISVGLLLVCLFSGSCIPTQDFDNCLKSIVGPYRFSIAKWECRAVPPEVSQRLFGRSEKVDNEVYVVTKYFSLAEQMKALKSEIKATNSDNNQGNSASLEAELNRLQQQKIALKDIVERIMEGQIREVLVQLGIFNPIDEYIRLEIGFPPLNFRLDDLPYLLVISPRDRIESMREVLLLQNLNLEEIEDIEARVEELAVSSLIVKIGGFGATYPTLVADDASLRFTINTATEEWLHQYLAFKPLGFRYILDLTGISRNYEIATMNEALASMVSKEIGSIIYEKYYSQYDNDDNQTQVADSGFDFNQEMREIRKAVDEYLAQGEIERAEEFMEEKRRYLASEGYYIRKLNQAYFAFYGTYADSPTSVSPIGAGLKELRSQSASLKDFLNTVAGMTSAQDLEDMLTKSSP